MEVEAKILAGVASETQVIRDPSCPRGGSVPVVAGRTVSFNLLFYCSFLCCVHFFCVLCSSVLFRLRRWPPLAPGSERVRAKPPQCVAFPPHRLRESKETEITVASITHRQWRQSATSCRHGAPVELYVSRDSAGLRPQQPLAQFRITI